MIHVASLLHDDVIDSSPLRRSQPSAPSAFGNKLSILSGDFLLGRASVALARLGSREVVELLATVIANLVEGEVMQLRATSEPEIEPTRKGFEDYMRKTYLKTASLMAKSARAAVILGGCGRGDMEWVKDVAYGYGRNIGIAFQVSGTSAADPEFIHTTHHRHTIYPCQKHSSTYHLFMPNFLIRLIRDSIFLNPCSR
jgi:hexaprenyl-diphosphate synthase